MYCPTCGAECPPHLNYCNRCGATVNAALQAGAPVPDLVDIRSPVRVLGSVICLTTLLGLVILFCGLSGLASWNLDPPVIGTMGVFGLLLLFGVDIGLIRLLSRLLSGTAGKSQRALSAAPPPARELYTPPVYQSVLPEPAPSVTEHTTRTFSPVYREPRS